MWQLIWPWSLHFLALCCFVLYFMLHHVFKSLELNQKALHCRYQSSSFSTTMCDLSSIFLQRQLCSLFRVMSNYVSISGVNIIVCFSQNKIAKIIKMKDNRPKKILTNMWFITQRYKWLIKIAKMLNTFCICTVNKLQNFFLFGWAEQSMSLHAQQLICYT